jgi:hypothetical protein
VRRFGRWMFNGLMALSLVLSLAIAALWLISIRTPIGANRFHPFLAMRLSGNVLTISRISAAEPWHRDPSGDSAQNWWFGRHSNWCEMVTYMITSTTPQPAMVTRQSFLGFRHLCMTDGHSRWETFEVPIWQIMVPPLLVSALAGTLWRRQSIRARRIQAALCINCGYDLRATPERCPECGTVIGKVVQAK